MCTYLGVVLLDHIEYAHGQLFSKVVAAGDTHQQPLLHTLFPTLDIVIGKFFVI